MPSSLYALKVATEKVEMIDEILKSLDQIIEITSFFFDDNAKDKLDVIYHFIPQMEKLITSMDEVKKVSYTLTEIRATPQILEDAKQSAKESQKNAKDSKINANEAKQSANEAQQSAKEAKTDMHILKAFRALGVGRWYIKDGALHIKPFEDMGMAPALKDGALILKIS